MEAVAKLNRCPLSPRKTRYVVDQIRGLNVMKAIGRLKFIHKAPSLYIEKLVLSAIKNWENANDGLKAEDYDLFIKTVFVDSGRMLKRFRPAPQGRAYRIRKRSNHITLIVDSRIPVAADLKPVEETVEEVAVPAEVVETVASEPKPKKKSSKKTKE